MRNGNSFVVLFAILAISTVCYSANLSIKSTYLLYWPKLKLDTEQGERIDGIKVVVTCGKFRTIAEIPNDWSVSVGSPSGGEAKLEASSGHGSTALWNMHKWDGVISIVVNNPECFSIAAEVIAAKEASSRTILLG